MPTFQEFAARKPSIQLNIDFGDAGVKNPLGAMVSDSDVTLLAPDHPVDNGTPIG